MPDSSTSVVEKGVLALSEAAWQKAKRRADVIASLAEHRHISHIIADATAQSLGVSRRTVYELVRRWRSGDGVVTDLAPKPNLGGKGKSRLSAKKEELITDALTSIFLSRPRRSVSAVMREVRRQSLAAGVHPPATNTVAKRIRALDPEIVAKRRRGADAARELRPVVGETPRVSAPMDVVQIDHTVIDVMIVDPTTRQVIGRPYLTIAIDEFSRCVIGMVVTLEAPSAVSVGLCLAHAAAPKNRWVERLGVEADWPMCGIPRALYLDNAPEFKGEALRRGCEQYGIAVHHRPVARPNYGGIVERIIGTVMKWAHELPGTTFSNPAEKEAYASERAAALTLLELEKWMTLAICGVYHQSVHSTLREPPASRWSAGVAAGCAPKVVTNPDAFLVDFLPVIRRALGRGGFVVDHIAYFSNALKPWIARRQEMGSFVIRRDPRDISRVWVLDPSASKYLEVPYRTLANPAVTLWEHRSAVAQLRIRGRRKVDELAIFRAVDEMREIVSQAAKDKRRARRDIARRMHLKEQGQPILEPSHVVSAVREAAEPFSDIEEW